MNPKAVPADKQGKYIYAIIEEEKEKDCGPIGMGGASVFTTNFKDLAAVVSDSEITEYPMSRENLIVHQRVLEKVMERFTILPVRFGTIAEHGEEIREKVLQARYGEFKSLLNEMGDKVELGVRASWADMEGIFAEIVEENSLIRQLREKIRKEASKQRAYAGKIKLGEMVQAALEEKKEREARELLAVLEPLSTDFRENAVYGDRNVLNVACLVEKAKEKEFDREVVELGERLAERVRLKYVGPVPPCNFVEVVVTW